MNLNLIDMFSDFLKTVQEDNQAIRDKEYKDRFFASNAGLCYRKLYYHEQGMPKNDISDNGLRNMRLGTVFGADFERAIGWYFDKYHNEIKKKNLKYYSEEFLYSSHMKPAIGGHFDALIVDESDENHRKGYLYDVKTTNVFKYGKLFGKKPDEKPSYNYELQLGTYANLLEESKEHCDEVVFMANIYLNKDFGQMQMKEAGAIWKEHAKNYWLNYLNYNGEEPAIQVKAVPFYPSWECDNCSYSVICDSPHIKKRKVNETSKNSK